MFPLFKASEMSHLYVPWSLFSSTLCPVTICQHLHESYPSHVSQFDLQLSSWFTDMSLKILVPSNRPFPMECFQSLLGHPCIYALNKGSLESTSHFLPIHIWCQSLSVTLTFYLMLNSRIHHFLGLSGPSPINFNTCILGVWLRGLCTLDSSSSLVSASNQARESHQCSLTWLFLMCSTSAHHHMLENHTLDRFNDPVDCTNS
jgi:hypothetical protein